MKIFRTQALLAFGTAIVMSMVLFACKKDSDGLDGNGTAARIMAFNLTLDRTAVKVNVGGNSLTASPMNYTAYTGTYLNINPGSRVIESYDNNTNGPVANTTYTFDAGKYYSVFVVGPNLIYQNVIVQDNFDSLSAASGMAYVRYINAVPSQSVPTVKLSALGSDIVNTTAPFASVSAFKAVTPADLTLSVNNLEGDIQTTRTIPVVKGHVYTMLIVGEPGSTNADKKVQVRFIENGTL